MTAPSPSAVPRVVVLGDTRDLHHHGCEAVLAQLLKGLADIGMPADTVIAGFDWQAQTEECLSAALVVINGEGALHHDRPVVHSVLELAARRRALGRPTALVNSSWFANAPAATRRLADFDLLGLRDPVSREEAAAVGVTSLDAPDLAIREACQRRPTAPPAPPAPGPFMVSDSTRPELTRTLRRLARRRGWTYLPVLYPPTQPRPGAKSRKIWKKTRMARLLGPLAVWLMPPRYHAHLVGAPDLAAYCHALAGTGGVVTGRFHTACLCLGLGVPVLAVQSNTPKIAALLADAGLDPAKRMVEPAALATLTSVPPYTPEELAALDRFRSVSEVRFQQLFSRLRALLPPDA